MTAFRNEADKILDEFLSQVYIDSEDENHVVQAVVRPDVFNRLRQKLTALHKREVDAIYQAILDDKPLTTVESTINVWKERIERRRANGDG